MANKEKALLGICQHPRCSIPVVTYPGQLLRKWCGPHRQARELRLKRLKELGKKPNVLRSRGGQLHSLPL
jgi:hypothetical protein